MFKNKNKKDSWWFWFAIGLSACLLVAPNATVIRVLVSSVEPLEFVFLRSMLALAVSAPFILFAIRKFNRRNLAFALGSALCMTISAISLAYAVKYSSASYAIIMGLLSPILLVVFSSRLLHDKISFRAASGVTLAAAGALLIVIAPIALSGNVDAHFYPLATSLMLINSIFFTLGIILTRKSHEANLPLTASTGVTSFVIGLISFIVLSATQGIPSNLPSLTPATWLGIFYSGVFVIFIARIMNISAYERIGAATTSGLSYLGTIVGITIPVLFLGEQLSGTILLGGAIILLGVYLTEQHQIKLKHRRYLYRH